MKGAEGGGEAPSSIRLFTYNCWGLKYIAKHRIERLQAIGRAIATTVPTPEIVGLQECWTQDDYLTIQKHTRHILPHGKFYFSGIFGGGLAILSKWPIVESNMVRYPLNGRPTAFFRGDWYVGKGVACATIQTGSRREDVVEVFCTHLHAPYEREPNDSYMCHRTAQAWEIARLMRQAIERGHAVVGLGDFNMTPSSLAHDLITAHAPVKDAWKALHPDSSLGAASHPLEKERRKEIPNARYNLEENGATCDSVLNTWRWSKQQQKKLFKGEEITIDPTTLDPGAKRLDYIFFGNGFSESLRSSQWAIESARVGMTNRHPDLNCSLSDHFSVEATIVRLPRGLTAINHDQPKRSSTHEQTTAGALQSLTNTSLHPTLYTSYNPSPTSSLIPVPVTRTPSPQWPSTGSRISPTCLSPSRYDEILTLISTYMAREYRQRRLRLGHFLLSIAVSIICFIGIWWTNHPGWSFLLVFVSTINFGGGIIDGLIGGLFVGSEIRALKEFRWEISQAKGIAEKPIDGESAVVGSIGEQGTEGTKGLRVKSPEDENKSVETEKELWEKVRGSEEYLGKENVRRGF
ncbi:MAG: hypothetical protein LQ350_002375 [Teloschistes chrysophthalmus]|nr:MAG: hypothetical protein LQ350_002375 [Niorma chrysophthalma]